MNVQEFQIVKEIRKLATGSKNLTANLLPFLTMSIGLKYCNFKLAPIFLKFNALSSGLTLKRLLLAAVGGCSRCSLAQLLHGCAAYRGHVAS